jgi:SAM-dependent methyltransferase
MSYITYKKPTAEEFVRIHSETEKYRYASVPYLSGVGVDIASQGVAVVPWAISYDLPHDEFSFYSNGSPPKGPLQLRGFADKLPFEDQSLDFVYSSHYIEDVFDWKPIIKEWDRVLKIGGHMVILLPDRALWNQAIERGQPPNCSHRHESFPGELSEFFGNFFGHYEIVKDELTAVTPQDYNIIFVAKRVR